MTSLSFSAARLPSAELKIDLALIARLPGDEVVIVRGEVSESDKNGIYPKAATPMKSRVGVVRTYIGIGGTEPL